MNVKAKSTKLDWKKIALIALVLAVAGYEWYRQNYPAEPAIAVDSGQSGTFSDKDYQVNFPSGSDANNSATNHANAKPITSPRKSAGPFLEPAGGRT